MFALAPRFNFQTLRYSEEVFLKLVVIHTIQLVVNMTLLSLHCAISVGKQPHQNQNPSYPTAVSP